MDLGCGALSNSAGIFFLFPLLCLQPEIVPQAICGPGFGALANAGWSPGFSLAFLLTCPWFPGSFEVRELSCSLIVG